MGRTDSEVYHKRQKQCMTAGLRTDDLANRMEALADAVTTFPQGFTIQHAAKLRNAAQVATAAAELIALEIENERSRSNG